MFLFLLLLLFRIQVFSFKRLFNVACILEHEFQFNFRLLLFGFLWFMLLASAAFSFPARTEPQGFSLTARIVAMVGAEAVSRLFRMVRTVSQFCTQELFLALGAFVVG